MTQPRSQTLPGTQVLYRDTPSARIQRLRVEVRRGPDKGQVWDLDVEPARIGTSEGCDVRLKDGAVSGVHVELSRTRHGVSIRDLGSTNGTYVDGRRIQAVFATDRTTVVLGETELRLSPLADHSPIELLADDRFGDLVGRSVAMRAVFARLERVARANTTVLITGETGTGKELAAAAIHERSNRKNGPFVVVDCAAMPANLIESELLGHERGAFTGTDRTRHGAFERAHGGSIFLDEIGELPLALQPALLGILERREARRVGGHAPYSVDVRVITATNRDLAAEVARGAFRSDLYYRLAVLEIRLPSLRERVEDIALLVEHFLTQLPGDCPQLTQQTIEQLKAHTWPGNVRELRNVIERAALLAEQPQPRERSGLNGDRTGDTEHAKSEALGSDAVAIPVNVERPFKDQKNDLVSRFEESYVRQLTAACGGNIARAARQAGIDRMYLYKLLSRYALEGTGRDR